jgi:hypothetical protein
VPYKGAMFYVLPIWRAPSTTRCSSCSISRRAS